MWWRKSRSEKNMSTLVKGINQFGCDLLKKLREQEEDNLFFSPYNISQTVALAWAGAETETARQIADVMHYGMTKENLHNSFKQLNQKLHFKDDSDENNPVLYSANAAWVQESYPVIPSYLDMLVKYYESALKTVDFEKAQEAAADEINRWVAEQTRGKITEIISPRDIDVLTRMILSGAIYFLGKWTYEFDHNDTTDTEFKLPSREIVTVRTMWNTEPFRYAKGKGFQALELPYRNGPMAMLVLLPDEGGLGALTGNKLHDLEKKLDADLIASVMGDLKEVDVEVTVGLPRFELDVTLKVEEALEQMGMPIAFDTEKADFSGIVKKEVLSLGQIRHKAYVKVEEQGTEAAAATLMDMLAAGIAEENNIFFHVNRPFIFLIFDRETKAVLFLGSVINPNE